MYNATTTTNTTLQRLHPILDPILRPTLGGPLHIRQVVDNEPQCQLAISMAGWGIGLGGGEVDIDVSEHGGIYSGIFDYYIPVDVTTATSVAATADFFAVTASQTRSIPSISDSIQ